MKYSKEFVEELCSHLREGDSNIHVCKKMGISEETFYKWIATKDEFSEAVKKAKREFQDEITAKLEVTLWKKAQGYEVTETETEFINDKTGKPQIKNKKTKIKHIQPDTAALIFALTNLAPDKWKNRQTQDVKSEVVANVSAQMRYDPSEFTEDEMQAIVDQLQEAEHNKMKREKENGE